MVIKSEVEEVVKILKGLEVPFYFHAGFGLHLRGLESELDDCDIRVYHPDIKEVYQHVKKQSSHEVRLRGSMPYEKGTYDNQCIEILNGTNFDICSRMVADCDIGRFEFPFSNDVFSDVTFLPYENMSLPVASPENLFLYYLVLRRDHIDGKNDKQRVKDLITSGKFNPQKFQQTIPSLPCSDKVQELYSNVMSQYANNGAQD